jgi:hypothetical protein
MKCVRRRVTVYKAGNSISILNSTQLRGAETFYLGLIEEHVGGEVVNSTAAERAHREICRTVEEEEGEEEGIWICERKTKLRSGNNRARQCSAGQKIKLSSAKSKVRDKTERAASRTAGHETFEIRFYELYEHRGV